MSSQTEDIKNRLNIVDLIQSYIRLEKAGINFRARCPFHQEKTPSFFVSPTRQSWRCFGCQKGGDHFTFVEEIEHVEFPEALEILANRAGIQLKKEDPRVLSERTRLFSILEEAAKFFEKNLWGQNENRATPMTQYLLSRGLHEETIKMFRVGFAPDSWDGLLNYLLNKGFRSEDIEKAGLIIKKQEAGNMIYDSEFKIRNHYDRFRSRIMFPITDTQGRVIAFGGRIFGSSDTEGAKYINSPETTIYSKSRVLYAFDKAKTAIREKNECVLVEGYMDTVMAHQAGLKHTVAVSGTALTQEQLHLIHRLAEKIVFAFDMDSAGQSATRRSLDLAGELGIERKIILLPSGKDPADAVKENPAILLDALQKALPLMEYYIEDIKKRFDLHDSYQKKQAAAFFLPHLRSLRNEIERSHWIQAFAELLSVPESSIRKELEKIRDGKATKESEMANVASSRQRSRRELLEREFLSLYASSPDAVEMEVKTFESIPFSVLAHERLFQAFQKNKAILASEYVPHDPNLKTLFSEIKFRQEFFEINSPEELGREARVCLVALFGEYYREKMQELNAQIKDLEKTGNRDRIATLLKSFNELSEKRSKIISHQAMSEA